MDNNNYPTENYQGGNSPRKGGAGMAIASMVLGILSILFSCCLYYVALPCGLVGLVLGAVAIKKDTAGKGMAVAGVVLSIISLALAVITIAMGGALLAELGLMSNFMDM